MDAKFSFLPQGTQQLESSGDPSDLCSGVEHDRNFAMTAVANFFTNWNTYSILYKHPDPFS